MMHSYSSALMAVFTAAREQGKNFSLICTESRPLRESRLAVKVLRSIGVPVTYITDAEIWEFMPRADLIIMGADSIAWDGSVANKMGTALVSQLALACKKPVYIASELYKVNPATAEGHPIELERRVKEEIVSEGDFDSYEGIDVINQFFDLTPAWQIRGLITEFGVIARPAPASTGRSWKTRSPATTEFMSRGDGFVDAIIRMRGISKSFGSLRANDSIDFELYPGETHALVGENGAGKTTLMRILYGQYKADSGTIEVDGKPVTYNVAGAMKLGIGMVHQNFMQIEKMSILENIIMASAPSRFGFIRYKETRGKVQEMLRRFGLEVSPDVPIGRLCVGERQKVEIIKALYLGARVLILDEPTAVLTPQETMELFRIIEELKGEGKSIIFISHKLREVVTGRRPHHRHPRRTGRGADGARCAGK